MHTCFSCVNKDHFIVLILLSFGVFFDGTLNSIANIDERKNYENFLRKVDAYTLIANLDVFEYKKNHNNN